MAARLRENAFACIDENNSKVGKGRTAGHVARVLLVSRCVGTDKAAVICRKVTVCNIDRYALLAFRHQTIEQQRIVDVAAAAANL